MRKFTKKLTTETLNLFGTEILDINHPLAKRFVFSDLCSWPFHDNVYLAKVKDVCSKRFIRIFDKKLYRLASRKFEEHAYYDLPPTVTWFENIKEINEDTSVGDMYVELRIKLNDAGSYYDNTKKIEAYVGLSSLPRNYVLGSYGWCHEKSFNPDEIDENIESFREYIEDHFSIEEFETTMLRWLGYYVEEAEKNTDSEGYYKTDRFTSYDPERILRKFGTIFTTRGDASCFESHEFMENYRKAEELYPTCHYKYNPETYKKEKAGN